MSALVPLAIVLALTLGVILGIACCRPPRRVRQTEFAKPRVFSRITDNYGGE